jgi:penicillin-binding protein-related factor A (putative recombinase)
MTRASQAQGRNFEDVLEWVHHEYLLKNRAAIYHNHVAGRFVAKGVFVPDPGKARPDYSGTLAGGISVHFDAKTLGDMVGWRLSADRLHQYEMLLDQAKMGAIAFFLVECRPMQAVFLLRVHPSIPVVDDRPEIFFDSRTPAVNGPDCRPGIPAFCLEVGAGGSYDWLSAVEWIWVPTVHHLETMPTVYRTERNQRRSVTLARNQQIIQRWRDGETVETIARDLDLAKDYLRQILNGAGIKFKRGRKPGVFNAPRHDRPLKTLAGVHQGHIPGGIHLRSTDEVLDPPIAEGNAHKGKS